jgi:hypothetical protein
VAVLGCALALLAGCSTTSRSCGGNQDYLEARERPPLQMPEGVTGSERVGGQKLVIPPVSPTSEALDPQPACLDDPPGYFKRKTAPTPPPDAPAAPAAEPKPPGT